MQYVSKRNIRKEATRNKYIQMYVDVVANEFSWKKLAKTYHYKNSRSVRSIYYLKVVPLVKQLEAEGYPVSISKTS